jgi:peptidoglycan/xylan/chitin deacetylase (PgdA/CDA1 family)
MAKKMLWTIALAWSLLLWSCSEQPKKSIQDKEDIPSELYDELNYSDKDYEEWKIGVIKYPKKYDSWDRFDEKGHLIRKWVIEDEEEINDTLENSIDVLIEDDSIINDSVKIDSIVIPSVRWEDSAEKKKQLIAENTKKQVYITIDDGPWLYTQEIAEELHKRGHRATFFVIWNNIKENLYEAMKNAEEMWHEFWNHSFSHANFRKISFDQAKEQLEKTEKWIKAAWVTPAPYFRYPYWSSFSNEKMFDVYMKWMWYEEVFWTIDTRDWSKSTTKKDLIRCLENVKQWDVILIHERPYTKDRTIPTIDSVLKSKWFISVPYRKK